MDSVVRTDLSSTLSGHAGTGQVSGAWLAIGVWAVLVGVTLLSFGLAEHAATPARLASAAAVLIAGFKARLVFLHFMELKHAPPPWRILFELWIGLCMVMILAGQWLAAQR